METWGVPGPVFLAGYAAALVALIGMVALRRRSLRGIDDAHEIDPYEAAYLTGGEPLVVTAALAALRERGIVIAADGVLRDLAARNVVRLDRLDDKQTRNLGVAKSLVLAGPVPFGLDPVEAAAAAAVGPVATDIGQVRRQLAAAPALTDLRGRLEVAGLLRSDAHRSEMRRGWPLVAALVALGVVRFLVGASRGRPVGYLGLLIVGAVALLGWTLWVPPETGKARAALDRLRARNGTGRGGPRADTDAALTAALFGAGALWAADPALAWALDVPRRAAAGAAAGGGVGCGGGFSGGDGGGGGGDGGGGGGDGGGCGGGCGG